PRNPGSAPRSGREGAEAARQRSLNLLWTRPNPTPTPMNPPAIPSAAGAPTSAPTPRPTAAHARIVAISRAPAPAASLAGALLTGSLRGSRRLVPEADLIEAQTLVPALDPAPVNGGQKNELVPADASLVAFAMTASA